MKMKFNVQVVRLSVRQNWGNAAHRFQLASISYWSSAFSSLMLTQVVCALRPQCIILRDFQYGGRLLWCERFFAVYLFISFSALAHLFYTKMLYLESLGVVKSDFGIEVLTFRACPGNLWHFSNKVKFFHFRLCLVGRNFWSLTAFGYWCLA